MGKTRFALVGCGNIARKHAHVLHEFLEDADDWRVRRSQSRAGAGVLREVRRTGLCQRPRDDAAVATASTSFQC